MKKHLSEVLSKFDQQINTLLVPFDNPLKTYEKIVLYIAKFYKNIKEEILLKDFQNEDEEIEFFKKFSPHILSKLIYYNDLYRYEMDNNTCDKKSKLNYFLEEEKKLNKFFKDNVEFHKYYLSESNHFDHLYFVRNKHNVRMILDAYLINFDPRTTTSHDYKLAQIIANKSLLDFLKQKIDQYPKKELKNTPYKYGKTPLKWTKKQIDLADYVYIAHRAKVFNNGMVTIKRITRYFEVVFDIPMHDVYGSRRDTKTRKKESIFKL